MAPPQGTIISVTDENTGNAAGLTVIVLLTEANGLLHKSVAVQVSVTVPPQVPGIVVNVEAFDVPVIWQPKDRPLLYEMALGAGTPPQATVISAGAVIVGNVAGRTVIVLLTGTKALPHASVAVQVSVRFPPQIPGIAVMPVVPKVEGFDVPDILQLPSLLLLNGSVPGTGIPPQATVILSGAVIVGNVAGRTVIVLEALTTLLQKSVYIHDSVMFPPHTPAGF